VSPQDSPLDPLGSLIYYWCVKEAIEGGGYIVPGSDKIAARLQTKKDGSGPIDDEINQVWQDLWWMNEKHLLFREQPFKNSEYFRPLSQHGVSERMKKFRPGFKTETTHRRRIVPSEFVEHATTAIQLVALKDLYYFNHRKVTHNLLLKFLEAQGFVTGADEFYLFLGSMNSIHYIELDPQPGDSGDPDRNKFYLVEPGPVFRNQDMYVELLGLDYFSEGGPPKGDRRARRLELHRRAEKFVTIKTENSRPIPENQGRIPSGEGTRRGYGKRRSS
jgi:hypothetical protein